MFPDSIACADPSTARYRIDVTGNGLALVGDDVAGSPGGAFVTPADAGD